jgi:hypothetical protein
MRRLTAILGYAGAALTVAVILVTPFVLINAFTRVVAATGIRVDPVYGGGDSLRTIAKNGYRIVVNRPVLPVAPLAQARPFVQLAWAPVSALAAHVNDEVDLDGDGSADLRASFEVPRDVAAALYADVTPLGDKVRPLRHVSRGEMSALVARVNDRIVLRVPLTQAEAGRERAGRPGVAGTN